MNKSILTPVKWTGCKRTQAKRIIEQMPDDMTSYCELFLGSGAVMMELLTNHPEKTSKLKHVIVSDTNLDLIAMWKLIKKDPYRVSMYYRNQWLTRNTYLGSLRPDDNVGEMVNHRNDAYYALREKYNEHYLQGTDEGGLELMTLLAFNFNGLVRYGKKGFNAACMPVVPGIHPDSKEEIINHCSEVLNKYNVDIECASYDSLYLPMDSVIYLDPPYKMFLNENGKDGVYNAGDFNLNGFSKWCKDINCKKLLVSFDGGEVGDKYFPSDTYTKITNDTGTSKFRRQMSKTREPNKKVKTSESLFIK